MYSLELYPATKIPPVRPSDVYNDDDNDDGNDGDDDDFG